MEKHKILVVEDEKDTRYLLTKLLTVNNFEVLTAENGKEALDVLERHTGCNSSGLDDAGNGRP